MLAYGFMQAMTEGRKVDVDMAIEPEPLIGMEVFRKGIGDPKEIPDCDRSGAQQSTMFFEMRSPAGVVRKVWVNEVDGLLVRGGPMKDGER